MQTNETLKLNGKNKVVGRCRLIQIFLNNLNRKKNNFLEFFIFSSNSWKPITLHFLRACFNSLSESIQCIFGDKSLVAKNSVKILR